jgi:ADP-L-glycero-D-manno-heptose 6-epimerase
MLVITGGAGFIGSALLWELNRLGLEEIVVVDNLAETEKWRNLVKRQYVDYLHRDRFYDLMQRDALPWKINAVAHLGACSSTTERSADFLMENNFHYSRDLCRYALGKKGAPFHQRKLRRHLRGRLPGLLRTRRVCCPACGPSEHVRLFQAPF